MKDFNQKSNGTAQDWPIFNNDDLFYFKASDDIKKEADKLYEQLKELNEEDLYKHVKSLLDDVKAKARQADKDLDEALVSSTAMHGDINTFRTSRLTAGKKHFETYAQYTKKAVAIACILTKDSGGGDPLHFFVAKIAIQLENDAEKSKTLIDLCESRMQKGKPGNSYKP